MLFQILLIVQNISWKASQVHIINWKKNKRQKQTFERGKELVYWQMPWDNNSNKTRLAFPPPKSYHESESESAQSCLTLCNPMDCSLLGSSIHGIFQARILEWVAMSFSRGSSRPRDWTWVSHTAGRLFTVWATREGPKSYHNSYRWKLTSTQLN